jgi:hypothetical protein
MVAQDVRAESSAEPPFWAAKKRLVELSAANCIETHTPGVRRSTGRGLTRSARRLVIDQWTRVIRE